MWVMRETPTTPGSKLQPADSLSLSVEANCLPICHPISFYLPMTQDANFNTKGEPWMRSPRLKQKKPIQIGMPGINDTMAKANANQFWLSSDKTNSSILQITDRHKVKSDPNTNLTHFKNVKMQYGFRKCGVFLYLFQQFDFWPT